MPAIGQLSVYDGASTPVQHYLQPVSVTRDKGKVTALWREQSATLPVDAQMRVTATVEQLGSGTFKTETRVEVPVQEVVTGSNSAGYSAPPRVAYVDTVVVTGFFNSRSTISGRRNARMIAHNLTNGIVVTVPPWESGNQPVPNLMDFLVAPT